MYVALRSIWFAAEMTPNPDALRSMGAAVFAAQMCEAAIALVAGVALQRADFDLLDVDSAATVYRQPIAALLNELGKTDKVDAHLAGRIRTWLENRHELVHRLARSMANTKEAHFWKRVKNLSATVRLDSADIVGELMALFMAYAAKTPRAKAYLDQHRQTFDSYVRFAQEARSIGGE